MSLPLFDDYDLRARFSVGLLYGLPFFVDILPQLWESWGFLPAVACYGALACICQGIGQVVRNMGTQKAQPDRAAELLMPESSLSAVTKGRYYRKLAQLESEFYPFEMLLSKPEKLAQPETEDLCKEAVRWVRGQTRDSKRFHFLREENINYGFCRNMLALKWPGIIANLAAIIVFVFACRREMTCMEIAAQPGVILHGLWLVYLFLGVNQDSVKKAAGRYAYALLETIDLLKSTK